jgi:hypothetical protein
MAPVIRPIPDWGVPEWRRRTRDGAGGVAIVTAACFVALSWPTNAET